MISFIFKISLLLSLFSFAFGENKNVQGNGKSFDSPEDRQKWINDSCGCLGSRIDMKIYLQAIKGLRGMSYNETIEKLGKPNREYGGDNTTRKDFWSCKYIIDAACDSTGKKITKMDLDLFFENDTVRDTGGSIYCG